MKKTSYISFFKIILLSSINILGCLFCNEFQLLVKLGHTIYKFHNNIYKSFILKEIIQKNKFEFQKELVFVKFY